MDPKETTEIFHRARDGDPKAAAELFPLVYDELRRIAAGYLRQQPAGLTLQPTALVHEAFLRLVDQTKVDHEDRGHFIGLAARVMRLVLIDATRRRTAKKRGGNAAKVPLEEEAILAAAPGIDVLALGEALSTLENLDERKARVVDLRIFFGMSVNEVADVLGVSPKTVEKDWTGARAWLRKELEP